MLNKINRIRKDREYSQIFRRSKPINTGNMAVRILKSPDETAARFGFVVSNKVEKRATRRNLLRRKMRAIVRDLIPSIRSGYSIVVVFRSGYLYPYDYNQIKTDFEQCLRLANVLK
ncbi:MAG: ribonuclease P protein component [Candidatus Berkelbacteria bacterium]|nr:ribonuclease P protein component [Candidatus Berkelbacteria bacterium]